MKLFLTGSVDVKPTFLTSSRRPLLSFLSVMERNVKRMFSPISLKRNQGSQHIVEAFQLCLGWGYDDRFLTNSVRLGIAKLVSLVKPENNFRIFLAGAEVVFTYVKSDHFNDFDDEIVQIIRGNRSSCSRWKFIHQRSQLSAEHKKIPEFLKIFWVQSFYFQRQNSNSFGLTSLRNDVRVPTPVRVISSW